jgi:hypothetical protein
MPSSVGECKSLRGQEIAGLGPGSERRLVSKSRDSQLRKSRANLGPASILGGCQNPRTMSRAFDTPQNLRPGRSCNVLQRLRDVERCVAQHEPEQAIWWAVSKWLAPLRGCPSSGLSRSGWPLFGPLFASPPLFELLQSGDTSWRGHGEPWHRSAAVIVFPQPVRGEVYMYITEQRSRS